MSSLRDKEGYLLIDHRASPGLSPDEARQFGYDPSLVAEGKIMEAPIVTCSHCQVQVILNPGRSRDRAVCRRCYNYICDPCALAMSQGVGCRPWEKVIDDLHEQASQSFNIKVL